MIAAIARNPKSESETLQINWRWRTGSDMAGLLGKMDELNSGLEEWPQYVERLGHFFETNGITGADNATKRSLHFLVSDRARTLQATSKFQKLLRSLLTPDKPSDKTLRS